MPSPAVTPVNRRASIAKKKSTSVDSKVVKRKIASLDADHPAYLFECPICMDQLNCEVFQCFNGHLFCPTCVHKFVKCPSCKVSMTKKIRNRAVEQMTPMIKHECPNQHVGCAVKCKSSEMDTHVSKDCLFTPRLICKKLGLKCEKPVKLAELANHLQEHGIQGCNANEVILQLDSGFAIPWTNRNHLVQNLLAFLSSYDNIFTVAVVLDFMERSASFVVRVIGSEQTAKGFVYKMELRSSDAEPNISVTSHEGLVMCYGQECDGAVPSVTEKSLFSISLRKLEILTIALLTIRVSIKPLGSTVEFDGSSPATFRCNSVANIFSQSTPVAPLSPKTPNARIPKTITLRRKLQTK